MAKTDDYGEAMNRQHSTIFFATTGGHRKVYAIIFRARKLFKNFRIKTEHKYANRIRHKSTFKSRSLSEIEENAKILFEHGMVETVQDEYGKLYEV